MRSGSYLVISPAKDEARYIEHTLKSMTAQTVKPTAWIIVDDGSTDATADIVKTYGERNTFINLVRNPHAGQRQPGSAVIRAFDHGLHRAAAAQLAFDYVVKLDCDLSFEPNYFESKLQRFAADPKLGIASGVYFESAGGNDDWHEILMPPYHAAGAAKMVRRACWEEIGGFVPAKGWDTVDEIRAISRGWRTTHFRDLPMRHWKVEGSALGPVRTSIMHGEIYYMTGGSLPFFLLKALHRMKSRPLVLSAAAMVYGYVRPLLARRPRLVTDREAHCYRSLLNQRIIDRIVRPKSAD